MHPLHELGIYEEYHADAWSVTKTGKIVNLKIKPCYGYLNFVLPQQFAPQRDFQFIGVEIKNGVVTYHPPCPAGEKTKTYFVSFTT